MESRAEYAMALGFSAAVESFAVLEEPRRYWFALVLRRRRSILIV
jgi:hypothetical protein